MAVNLGSVAVTAVQNMRGNRDFEDLVDSLELFAQNLMIAAIAVPPEHRVDETARARGFYEVWQAIASAYTGKHMSQTRPTLPSKVKERAHAE